jgi:hypothetical protein
MASFAHDCPHCGARRSTFSCLHAEHHRGIPGTTNVYGSCGVCGGGAVAFFKNASGTSTLPSQAPAEIQGWNRYQLLEVYPKRELAVAPEAVPEAASRAFVEGVENLADGRYTSAIAMFRRALDVGLKQFPSDIEAWRLEKRIDKLADAGAITKDMQTWAHKIRLEGNEAVHELDNPSKEQATELKLFTELFLTYLFTLPARVKANLGDSCG